MTRQQDTSVPLDLDLPEHIWMEVFAQLGEIKITSASFVSEILRDYKTRPTF